jgi:DNA repair ATPase RecN
VNEERNYEAEASEQGWTPKDDWKGPEEKWTDAKTFVERGEKIAGILKSKVDRLEHRVENLTEANKKFGEYHKQTLESQRKKNAERISELEGQLAQSITDGDGQAYTKTQREIDSLKSEDVGPVDDAQAWNQMAQSWATENPWYASNRKLARYADGISDEIRAEGYNGQAYFAELSRRVQEDFPEEFENPNKSKASGVEEPGQLSTADSKVKTYENLPTDAKAACNDFVKEGFMTREDFIKQYEWDE